MVQTLRCESGLKQWYDDGTLVIGRETPDIGVAQISPKHHDESARELGFDIRGSIHDNLLYARVIYDDAKSRGVDPLTPWYCAHSSHLALI